MATLHTYKCSNCGHEVVTDPRGIYAVMSGLCFNFHCRDCQDIVAISAHEIGENCYQLMCPECGGDRLETWNIRSICPRCQHGNCFVEAQGSAMMVD